MSNGTGLPACAGVENWLQGKDSNLRPRSYEPRELTMLLYPALLFGLFLRRLALFPGAAAGVLLIRPFKLLKIEIKVANQRPGTLCHP